ncbi:HK97 family phage prohead protease [Pontibaca salina]|uniref:HK97 family phage prohead protease n=1 Tax=Pontibaca salina TaxID=2795731 RepID=A0A934LZ43_9RHOB|nr:HK97 family phage prohead protease [Pontibaca salina]MBI6628273.1 HK97 family phage prohead protease [Pontibaca salina]
MLWAGHGGGLEIRKRASGELSLSGSFPYGVPAVLSDGGRTGRPKKEIIAKRAFEYRINTPSDHDGKPKEIHLLSGHDFGKPLASVRSGTLSLKDSDKALTFTATITEEMQEVSYVRDVLAALNAGLAVGISPGFRLPPKRRVAEPETVEDEGMRPEEGAFNAIIRTIKSALLYELSIVTRPAYPQTQIEARNWSMTDGGVAVPVHAYNRWRL